jgi:hypothetical protein
MFCPWGKRKKPLRMKGLYEVSARAALLAKPRRALLGPGCAILPFARELGLRPTWLDPIGPRPMAGRIAAHGCLSARGSPLVCSPASGFCTTV